MPDWSEAIEGTDEIMHRIMEQGDYLLGEEGEDEFEDIDDLEESEDSQEQSLSDQESSDSDSQGSDYGLIDLSSHRSNSSNG
jgi:hypothetical protein